MEQQQQQPPPAGGVPGPAGRRLHIAHRRSPSELTPLMSMFANPNSKPLIILLTPFPPRAAPRFSAYMSSPSSWSWQPLVLTFSSSSGAACHPATDRTPTAAATTDPGDSTAVCQHGDAAPWWRIQPPPAQHDQHVAPSRFPVPESATAAKC